MVLLLERSGSLIDLRRTQRRVAALLLSDKSVKLQKFKLRRRALHQGMCHVCSRVDTKGIFRRPNDHLYHKGFFHSSNNLDTDLQPAITYIPDDFRKLDCEDDDKSLLDSEENEPEKISVTIRRGSKSTKRPSPLRKENSRDSYNTDIDNDKQALIEYSLQRKVSDSTNKVTLPPIMQDRKSRLSNKSFNTIRKPSISRTPSFELNWLPIKSPYMSETGPSDSVTDPLYKEDRITVIPTSFDDKSVISGLSTFNEGTTPSKSSNDLDSKFASVEERAAQSKASPVTLPTRRTASQLYGKQSSCTLQDEISMTTKSQRINSPFDQTTDIWSDHQGNEDESTINRPQRFERENAMMTDDRDVPKRPNAGLLSERTLTVWSSQSPSTIPSKSGHQDNGGRFPIKRYDEEGMNLEHNIERVTTEMGNYSDNSSSKALSEDATIIFSERTIDTRQRSGRQETLCRCSTTLRETSKSQNICRTCGKIFRLDSQTVKSRISQSIHNSRADSFTRASSSTRCQSTRQRMLRHNGTNLNRSKTTLDDNNMTRVTTTSRQSTEDGHMTRLNTRSKTSLDDDTINRTNISSQSASEDNHVTRMNTRSKPVIDEDYMDLDSIIYEDDGRYWSSGEESTSPSSWYRHAHPFPLVNPDIHKLVYIQALKASRLRGKQKWDDLEFDEMIRRPNVFSYIPFNPDMRKGQPKDCGLRPYKSSKPKQGQLMKHIFGEISLDDFYKRTLDENKYDVIIEHSTSEVGIDKISR